MAKYHGSIEERLAQVSTQSRKKNLERAGRANSTLKTQDIIAAWRVHVPNEVQPTAKEIGAFRRNLKLAMIYDIPAFFAEVVERWQDIRQGELAWMDTMPSEPSFGFVALWTRYLKRGLNQTSAANARRSLPDGRSTAPATPTAPHASTADYDRLEARTASLAAENAELRRALVQKVKRRPKTVGALSGKLEKRHD